MSGRSARQVASRTALALVVALCLTSCDGWPWDTFHRNPRLKLFRSEVERYEAHILFQATWAPDGSGVYYLRTPTGLWGGGSLWRANAVGDSATLMLDGTFALLAVSLDGRTIGLATGDFTGEELVLLNVEQLSADTVRPAERDVCDLVFSRVSPRVLYYATGSRKLFRYVMDNHEHYLVDSMAARQFVLTNSDSALLYPDGRSPALDPSGRYVAYSVGWDQGVFLEDKETGDTAELDANPYKSSWMYCPRWAPDGQSLIFTAGNHVGDPVRMYGGQLWTLDGVTEQRR